MNVDQILLLLLVYVIWIVIGFLVTLEIIDSAKEPTSPMTKKDVLMIFAAINVWPLIILYKFFNWWANIPDE